MTKHTEKNRNKNESRFLQLIEELPKVAVQGYDKERKVIYWNEASTSIYGFSREEALGRKLEDLIIPKPMREAVIEAHTAWLNQGTVIPALELFLLHKSGHSVPVYSTHVMLKEESDNPEMFCVDIDLSEQHKAKLELERIATTDQLTNLPNRRFLETELKRRINEAKRFGQKLAVMFIDLDFFKEINDTMGHNAGDCLLQSVAKRLQSHLRKYDTLSRFGGDEFVVILPNISDGMDAEGAARRIMAEFEHSFSLFEQNIFITASIGISVYPQDGESSDTLLKYSDAAMYVAKERGRNQYQFFNQSIDEDIHLQREISSNLRNAIDNNELQLVYQPQIDLKENRIIGCEALLRWHPKPPKRSFSPALFIPIAERSDLIIQIGEWVLKEACQQIAQWKSLGIKNFHIDVNVSGKQLEHSRFFSTLLKALSDFNLTASDIGLELTEHAFIRASKELLRELEQLQSAGMSISIDDFGTGYSSLNYLKQFPVNTLKIDRTFVTEAPHNPRDEAILEAIITVGHKLNMSIVVEGIETEAQANFCKTFKADVAQGYWYYTPMSAEALFSLLIEQQNRGP